jgi:hypothetical protein
MSVMKTDQTKRKRGRDDAVSAAKRPKPDANKRPTKAPEKAPVKLLSK